MSVTLTPNISAAPFNSNVAFNNSWITVDNNQNRSLFAQTVYALAPDTNDLLTLLLNEIRQEPNKNGFDFVDDTNQYSGNYECLKVIADCKFAGLTGDQINVGNLSAYELPQGFEITGEIYSFQLQYGAVIAYKAVDINRFTNSILDTAGRSLITLQRGEGIVTIQG
jgi:hypothetical protein